jgi:hypothetical protein
MSLEQQIEKAIRAASKKAIPVMVTEGIVDDVNKNARTCNVNREDLSDLTEVRLNAILEAGENVLTIFPRKGSKVLCIIIENDPTDAYVLAANEIEEISGQIGEMTFKWNADGFEFNGGSLGGMVDAGELKTQLEKLTARVDGIIDAINNGIPVAQDGGAALQTSIKASLALIVDKENFESLENENIKHG